MSDTTPPMPPTSPSETSDDPDDVQPEVQDEVLDSLEADEPADDAATPDSPYRTDKSVEELAQEVLDGKWGDGHDRHLRLAQADYDHRAVQRAVEALLKYQQS